MTSEIEDEELWPDSRIAIAKAEIAAEEHRRAQARITEEDRQRAAEFEAMKIHTMSDQEFRKHAENLCAAGDAAKRAQREADLKAALEAQAQNARGY